MPGIYLETSPPSRPSAVPIANSPNFSRPNMCENIVSHTSGHSRSTSSTTLLFPPMHPTTHHTNSATPRSITCY
ncbi:hypothetical protein J1614_004419 [Plenodomus biglobosus]|nr:hypothetical protein J1614_004419 [Plenodomus biglobosus]